ncbi:DMT family transporter [Fulvimonas yonginensis]|uniref:DMT family transporter n=1 Tax=Fulvimonas yonginensis TaxID=1495200 RepID=A0ABU8JBS7_9GAMM
MKRSDLGALLLLGALWGGSFLFMRMGAQDFGGFALAGLRALGAALCFLPLLASADRRAELRRHAVPITVVGVSNAALPYALFSLAARSLPAGLSAIFDALTPLLVAASGWLWLGEKLDRPRLAGLLVGLAGVLWLIGGSGSPGHAGAGSGWAIAACLGAVACYAFTAHYSERYLPVVSPLTAAAGGQFVSALLLAPTTLWLWPAHAPGVRAWLALTGLAVLCTAVAYVLFFRLIGRIGAARTMVVLYLIPAFAVLWGALFLREPVTLAMAGGCAVILLGVALTTGLLPVRTAARRHKAAARGPARATAP